MDFHLDGHVVLDPDSEFKSLYPWSLKDVFEGGQKVGKPYCVWPHSLYFYATDFSVNRIFAVERYVSGDEASPEETTNDDSRSILAKLLPSTDCGFSDTTYSMFSTDRIINAFELRIRPLDSEDAEERCRVSGSPSHTRDIEFRNVTFPDTLDFQLYVTPSRFQTFLDFANAPNEKFATFGVGSVPGFYAEWSPSFSTDKVKVLDNKEDQRLLVPQECDFDPPVLGWVGRFSLHLQSRSVFATSDEIGDQGGDGFDESDDERPPVSAQHFEPQHIAQLAATLAQSMRKTHFALCVIAVLLILIWLK